MNHAFLFRAVLVTAALMTGTAILFAQHSGHGSQSGNPSTERGRQSDSLRVQRPGGVEGRLVAETEDSITLEVVTGGEPARITYGVDQRTEFRGAVRVGSRVSVTFVERDGLRTALIVAGPRRRGC